MRAAIAPHTESGSIVEFDLTGNPYYSGQKRVSSQMSLSQSTIIYDFGFSEGDREIVLSEIKITKTQRDRLKEMQQSTTCASYYFSDGVNVYNTKIKNLTINPFRYNKFKANITLQVVEKIV